MICRRTLQLHFAVLLVGGLTISTTADLEAPESVTGPYMARSAWSMGPYLQSQQPIDSPWIWWQRERRAVTPFEVLGVTARLLDDWRFAVLDARAETLLVLDSVVDYSRPLGLAMAGPPSRSPLEPTLPAYVTLPVALSSALESAGWISFRPHADLAWAQAPLAPEEAPHMITFMGEGAKPHGTLDYAGHAPTNGAIGAD